MTTVLTKGTTEHARKLRAMSGQYFIPALNELPAVERQSVERDLAQLQARLQALRNTVKEEKSSN